jgi:hypothetical protein
VLGIGNAPSSLKKVCFANSFHWYAFQ